ncbi:MAG: restriction endonuclease subunit S, partial [Anaerobutyricum sp.]
MMKLLSKYVEFKNGKKRPTSKGTIPVYGGNGILDYTNTANMQSGVVIGRVGVYCGSVFLVREECWVSDNAIKAMCKENMDLGYLYYLLSSLHLNERRIGTSQPLLTQSILNNIEVEIPELAIQKRISSILELFDEKIKLNNKINNNLEQQAQALFKEWFIDNPENIYWSTGTFRELIQSTLALVLACILNKKDLRFKGFFRTMIFVPCTTSLVAYSIIFRSLFANNGLVNYVLVNIGILDKPYNFLTQPFAAKMVILLGLLWRWTGYNMVFFLSGLQNIEYSVYEAAKIDGASAIQTFFKITVPL